MSKAENAPSGPSGNGNLLDGAAAAQLTAAAALVLLQTKQYQAAARKFAACSGDLGDCGAIGSGSCVVAAEDVALYGALCGLAEFERDEVQRVLVKGYGKRARADSLAHL